MYILNNYTDKLIDQIFDTNKPVKNKNSVKPQIIKNDDTNYDIATPIITAIVINSLLGN